MRKPLYEYILGAPIQIGTEVIIGDSDDETFDKTYRGWRGIVVYLEYQCGCGQTYPEDPMIGVRFANGDEEEFWIEELHPLSSVKSNNQ